MTAGVQAPAASYGCLVGRTSCRACRPDAVPCGEFADYLGSPWCAQCGWTEWSHADVPRFPGKPGEEPPL